MAAPEGSSEIYPPSLYPIYYSLLTGGAQVMAGYLDGVLELQRRLSGTFLLDVRPKASFSWAAGNEYTTDYFLVDSERMGKLQIDF